VPILICREMGWSYQDYSGAPAQWRRDILALMVAEAEAKEEVRAGQTGTTHSDVRAAFNLARKMQPVRVD